MCKLYRPHIGISKQLIVNMSFIKDIENHYFTSFFVQRSHYFYYYLTLNYNDVF